MQVCKQMSQPVIAFANPPGCQLRMIVVQVFLPDYRLSDIPGRQDNIRIASMPTDDFTRRVAITADPLGEDGIADLTAPLQDVFQPLQALRGDPFIARDTGCPVIHGASSQSILNILS